MHSSFKTNLKPPDFPPTTRLFFAMTKPFKLRIHLPSFQFCRSIASSVLANTPYATQPSIPPNPKTLHAAYLRSPGPPPSSPNQPSYKFLFEKLYNTPENSAEFEAKTTEKGDNEEAASSTESVSPLDSGWFSSEEEDDDNDECLLSSSPSFSSSSENGHKIVKKQVRQMKSSTLNNWKDGERKKLASARMLPESGSSGRISVLGRLLPCVVDGMVHESYAILKKSSDPFNDFKMSMMEMIQEKQISEPDDLEKLLMCFLSLNAKGHHAVIVAAFTEVWEELHSSKS